MLKKHRKEVLLIGIPILLLVIVIFFSFVYVNKLDLIGKASYNTLSAEQKQVYWDCFKTNKCSELLAAKKNKEYRECSLSCNKQAQTATANIWCEDSDKGDNFFEKGIVKSNIYLSGKEDSCYSYPEIGKTYLFEGRCKDSKYQYMQKNCAEVGENFVCVDGACTFSCINYLAKSLEECSYDNLYDQWKLCGGPAFKILEESQSSCVNQLPILDLCLGECTQQGIGYMTQFGETSSECLKNCFYAKFTGVGIECIQKTECDYNLLTNGQCDKLCASASCEFDKGSCPKPKADYQDFEGTDLTLTKGSEVLLKNNIKLRITNLEYLWFDKAISIVVEHFIDDEPLQLKPSKHYLNLEDKSWNEDFGYRIQLNNINDNGQSIDVTLYHLTGFLNSPSDLYDNCILYRDHESCSVYSLFNPTKGEIKLESENFILIGPESINNYMGTIRSQLEACYKEDAKILGVGKSLGKVPVRFLGFSEVFTMSALGLLWQIPNEVSVDRRD